MVDIIPLAARLKPRFQDSYEEALAYGKRHFRLRVIAVRVCP